MINILSEETVNKIAAGEVVERPLSVVKELIENSIDAGATAITTEIKDGGISFIRITDNGSGIDASEIRTAFLPHATSKIRDAEDLFSVSSLGFRGEALPSIAAVSKCEVITRTADSISGVRYVAEGGREISCEEIGAPAGTTFIIRDLFYNTPARRKFLKTPATEGSWVGEAVEKLALAHPEVSFRFINGGRTSLHTAGSGRLRDVIYAVYGREITGSLIEVSSERDGLKLCGYIGRPVLSRGNRGFERFEVNRRSVRSDVLTRALEDAYQGYTMQHRYPVAFLDLTVPAGQVDVNVHPAKAEVRFDDEQAVYDFVKDSVGAALRGSELIVEDRLGAAAERPLPPREKERAPEPFETGRMQQAGAAEQEAQGKTAVTSERLPEADVNRADGHSATAGTADAQAPASGGESAAEPSGAEQSQSGQIRPVDYRDELLRIIAPEEKAAEDGAAAGGRVLSAGSRPRFDLIGIYADTYLLVEFEGDLLLIDQHAAHEKVLYEEFMQAYTSRQITSQQCLPPIIITLSERELQAVGDHMEDFAALGYEIEPFGGRDIAVRAVPGNMLSIARDDMLREIIDELADERRAAGSTLIREKLAMMSCKAAVKGNMRLSVPEAEALLDRLLSLDDPYNCPHGRPTTIRMSKYEIEKKFKRIL